MSLPPPAIRILLEVLVILAAIWDITLAWSWFCPDESTLPQSPKTANLNAVLDPEATWLVKTGLASVPSRSRFALPKKTR